MKSYTDIEQSKKLKEILPFESADMEWLIDYYGLEEPFPLPVKDRVNENEEPCWSLAALLDILPTLDERNPEFCKDIRYNQWHIIYHGTATLDLIDTERYENLIDACYEMIIKLYKQKLL